MTSSLSWFLAKTVLSLIIQFYRIPGKNDDKWFDKVRPDKAGLWISRLIPIPTGWAALFLDYPDLGTAFRRVMDGMANSLHLPLNARFGRIHQCIGIRVEVPPGLNTSYGGEVRPGISLMTGLGDGP
jgi:hypothetical protein